MFRSLLVRHQVLIGLALVILIAITRSHHFASMELLPGASWAAFFLAGVYLRSKWAFFILLVETWMVDFIAYSVGGGSGFCLTPAYAFLLPAYGVLWSAGRWYSNRIQLQYKTLLPLTVATVVGTFVCELISSGSFYFFSGRFAEVSIGEFGGRLLKYFPSSLESVAFYVVIACSIHIILSLMSHHPIKQYRL